MSNETICHSTKTMALLFTTVVELSWTASIIVDSTVVTYINVASHILAMIYYSILA